LQGGEEVCQPTGTFPATATNAAAASGGRVGGGGGGAAAAATTAAATTAAAAATAAATAAAYLAHNTKQLQAAQDCPVDARETKSKAQKRRKVAKNKGKTRGHVLLRFVARK